MSETTAGVKWEECGQRENGDIYRRDAFTVRVHNKNWWAFENGYMIVNNFAIDHAKAKRDAERWILEREGRLPAPATDGGEWIACAERMPEKNTTVELRAVAFVGPNGGWAWATQWAPEVTHWRPLPVDPHAAAAHLFDGSTTMMVDAARNAARHVAGCAECRAKLEEKGGA